MPTRAALSALLSFSILLSACEEPRGSSDNPNPDSGTPDTGEVEDTGEDTGEVEDTGEDTGDLPPVHVEEEAGCDSLNPLYCAFPFPSDRYLERGADTVSGYRLAWEPEAIPDSTFGGSKNLDPLRLLDGFSPVTQIMTLFDRAPDLTLVATEDDIGLSLEPDSPTVILDLETGQPVAHWVELDARTQSPEETVIFLRLASRLEEDRSYAVAIRDLADDDGVPLEPSTAFEAFRSGRATDSEALEMRRPEFEHMFDALADAGVERSELQSAWWFHTASAEALRGDMLSMRSDALERLGDMGLGCTVTGVDEDYGGDGMTLRRITGTFQVPSYVDSPEPPARLVRDEDGRPVFQEYVDVEFTVIIPTSLAEDPGSGSLVTFGHGLLGNSRGYLNDPNIREMAYHHRATVAVTDWAGMAAEDIPVVVVAFMNITNFVYVAERLQQGMVNQIALTRTMNGLCREHEAFQIDGVPAWDPEDLYYVGASQGGIYGGTLMALSPDIDRGVLLVNGAVFPLMIERSTHYDDFAEYVAEGFPSRLDQTLLMPLAQHLWDWTDPSSYLPHLAEGLPGVGPKTVLSIAALHDAQVPNLATDQAMRMTDAVVISGSAREPWGFEVVEAPWEGTAYLTIDMGDPETPRGNLSPSVDAGGHYGACVSETAWSIMGDFLKPDGVVTMPCDGVCDPD